MTQCACTDSKRTNARANEVLPGLACRGVRGLRWHHQPLLASGDRDATKPHETHPPRFRTNPPETSIRRASRAQGEHTPPVQQGLTLNQPPAFPARRGVASNACPTPLGEPFIGPRDSSPNPYSQGERMPRVSVRGRRRQVRRRRRAPAAACALSPRSHRQDGYADRLRHHELRCVHGAADGPVQAVLRAAPCLPSRPTAARSPRSRAWPTDGELHPVQRAFHEQHGLQCGYCTPGMIMAAVDLLRENPRPVRRGDPRRPRGQPVPCTGYQNIVRAVRRAAAEMHEPAT